jgi:gliding motility-associated-like protein
MRFRRVLFFLAFLLFLCRSNDSYATHIYGGELLYKHISGNTYNLVLTLYGDCSADAGIFNSLYTAQPQVIILNGTSQVEIIRLDTFGIQGVDVSPVCPREVNNTTCNGGKYPGVRRFVYSRIINLPGLSPNWRFVYTGSMNLGGGGAGRSSQITNINGAGGSIMQLEATLNNTLAANTSPLYTTVPTPFYCINSEEQYNQGAIDGEGDSLAFSLIAGKDGTTGGPVSYIFPYTPAEPLATVTGAFSFSELNGQLSFTPSAAQNALVVNQVSEYRNGVLVGTSQREMTFIVAADCEGTPPVLKVANVVGGSITAKNVINICVGTPSLSFGININNPDADTTYIVPKNVPESAVLNINNNNTPFPSISFSWDTESLPTGVHTFYLDVKNNHCPIANRQTIAYTINVTPYPTVSAEVVAPTNCVHDAYVAYNLALGYLPRLLTVKQGSATLYSYADTSASGIIRDSLPVGNYTLIVSSNSQCQTSIDFSITDNGTLPLSPITKTYCQKDTSGPFRVAERREPSIVTWYDANNNVLSGAPTPSTAVPTTLVWYVVERYKVCTSEKVEVKAIIHPLPVPAVVNNPSLICIGDTIFLEATGGVKYTWSPIDRILTADDGRLFTRLLTAATFQVKAESEFGCVDSASFRYDNIKPCCVFSYPNAFTPNSDGRNDGFKVTTPGNTLGYKLAVYNRWGQMVFLSYDPNKYWDGTQYDVPCAAGTYFYYFEGRCLTGSIEKTKGDVTLIR